MPVAEHYEIYPGMSHREWDLIKQYTADMVELNHDHLRKGHDDMCMNEEEWKGAVKDHNLMVDFLIRHEIPKADYYYVLGVD